MDIPPEQVGEGLDEAAICDQRLEQRRPGADRRVVERVPALVEQLLEVAEPALRVRREHPRRCRLPAAVVAHPTEIARDREGGRDRRSPGPRVHVVCDPEGVWIRAEAAQVLVVDRSRSRSCVTSPPRRRSSAPVAKR